MESNNIKDEQIEELQKKISYLENYTDDLNSVILEMRKEIDALSLRIEKVKQNLEKDGTVVYPDERPPHY